MFLFATYDKATCGHIKQIRQLVEGTTKGTHSLSKYLRLMKNWADELADLLIKLMDDEEFTVSILDRFNASYKYIRFNDWLITFDELHEKLLNNELC